MLLRADGQLWQSNDLGCDALRQSHLARQWQGLIPQCAVGVQSLLQVVLHRAAGG